jgi:hypothetical protein
MEDIDWDYWLDLVYVEEWKACGLSLGINPKNIRKDFSRNRNLYIQKIYFDIKGVSSETKEQFDKRLDIIQNNKYSNYFAYGDTEVHLVNFVEWAITKNSFKDMPIELMSLLKPKDSTSPEILATVKESKIHLRDRNYSEFQEEIKRFNSLGKCAEHHGISRQLYSGYRDYAKNRDNPTKIDNVWPYTKHKK